MPAAATSRADARELVKSIAADHGYVYDDVWESMTPEVREVMQTAMRNLETMAGIAVKTLAQNLYTSEARFVFELLQNAEDNSFHKARKANITPYVSFELHSDRIIIECNEDGFEPKNLRAICAVGQSSKSGVQNGYVGEKGIGFKSVFMAAWKVYIQSGNFSFFFQHKRGDGGLGMISPVWREPENELPHPGTRMELLLGDGHNSISSSQHKNIEDEFNTLSESVLLFMKNIGEIRIFIYDDQGNIKRSRILSKQTINGSLIRLTKAEKPAQHLNNSSKDYFIFRHAIYNLSKNENRTYSEYEEKTKAYSSTEIVLGFPLTAKSVPIVEYQDIFTFLPMKQSGFKFLINSDFVTEANRQDIVTTSPRNKGIRRGIADAFIQAVLRFCKHSKLQYTWMRFLPDKNQHFDPFWSPLVTLLRNKLDDTKVLRPRSGNSIPRLISSLRFPLESQLDRHGEPLFRDGLPEMHLSKNYSSNDIKILRNYGLTELGASDILRAISMDLLAGDSRMKSKNMDEDWHTRSAKYLSDIFVLGDSIVQSMLRNLPMLPLQDGSWVAAENREVYFPDANGLEVPPGLGLSIIVSEAAQNVHRRRLFSHLGVKEAEISLLRQRILNKGLRFNTVASYVKQLQYMFLTDEHKSKSENKDLIGIADTRCKRKYPHLTDVYLLDSEPFGPSKLLENLKDTDDFSVDFLHISYAATKDSWKDGVDLTRSWETWLCSYVGVRRHLRIISKEDETKLSRECLYVATHLPDKFLGYLRHSWGQERKKIKSSSILIDQLQDVTVICYDGEEARLNQTYLPLPDLQHQWERFSRGSDSFPFLQLHNEITRETYVKDWGFLVSSLGVQTKHDLVFYLHILTYTTQIEEKKDIDDPSRIFELYGVIYGKYLESPDDENKNLIRNFFQENELVYVPENQDYYASVESPEACVWEGPESLSITTPLQARYSTVPIKNLSTVKLLFVDVLGIGNCDEEIICNELEELRKSGSDDFERIKSLYTSLWDMLREKQSTEARELIKEKFADEALIYTQSDNCWNKVSQCLWSSATTICSKKVLENDYKEMRSFFVNFLGVETLNIKLIYTELKKLGESTPTLELVKEQLIAFKDHLTTVADYDDVTADEMKKFKIFPVRHPGIKQRIEFCSGDAEFAIADRILLENNFRPKIKTLGFTFEDVHSLGPVIRWLGLEGKYLSRLVTETSKVEDSDRILNSYLSRNIRLRAYPLCRIAKHYNSLRWRTTEEFHSLYEMLKNVKIFETDKISCLQIVKQGVREYSHEISRSEFHLNESDSGLEIFIPQEKKRQAFCFAHELPAQLFKWMITIPSTNGSNSINDRSHSIVKDILKEDPDIYNQILLREGIVDIDLEEDDVSDDEDSVSNSSARGEASVLHDSTDLESNMATPLTDISSARVDLNQNELLPPVLRQDTIAVSNRFASPRSTNRLVIQEAPLNTSAEDIEEPVPIRTEAISSNSQYPNLLSQVVSAARSGSFPTKDIFDLDALRQALISYSASDSDVNGTDVHEFNASRSFPQQERHRMVGAAGELYVYELLKSCNPSLPDFGIDNWKSTIRKYARQHPEYTAMQPWIGHEESDLIYHDSTGAFTKLLIDKCYFDASTWEHRRPTYYLEVKSTTSSCETRFFVSKKQYKMLHDNHRKEDFVYIIMRVFNVGNSNIGLRVYIDPAELEAREELLFTTEMWSVVPDA